MKKLFSVSILMISCVFASHLRAETASAVQFLKRIDAPFASEHHFLLTYARSGTNLTSCYLQYLTGKPIKFLFEETQLAENRLRFALDYSKSILYRTHYPKDLRKINKQKNKLLYVLRNFKECLFRHNYDQFKNPEDFRTSFQKNKTVIKEYMEGLEIYDAWDPNMRLLIHYEDLITDPVSVMRQVLAFFDEPIPSNLTEQSLKEISKKALASYDKQHKGSGGSHSKGEDFHHHTRGLPLDILRDIDAAVESNYPVLWNQYLKVYKS